MTLLSLGFLLLAFYFRHSYYSNCFLHFYFRSKLGEPKEEQERQKRRYLSENRDEKYLEFHKPSCSAFSAIRHSYHFDFRYIDFFAVSHLFKAERTNI